MIRPLHRTAVTLAVALVFLAAGTSPSWAEDKEEPAFMAHFFAPELILQNAKAIGIEKPQRMRLMKELKRTQLAVAELEWNFFEAAEEINALTDGAVGTDLDETAMIEAARPVFDTEGKIKEEHFRLLVRIRNLLTADQRTQLAKIRDRG